MIGEGYRGADGRNLSDVADEATRARWAANKRAQMGRESPDARAVRLRRNRDRARARRAADPLAARRENAAAMRAWRAKHRDRAAAHHRAYREANRPAMRAHWRARSARKRGAVCEDRAARDMYAELLLGDPCSFCGAPSATVDHIDALSRGGVDEWHNLTAACVSCNSRKWAMPLLLTMLGTERL